MKRSLWSLMALGLLAALTACGGAQSSTAGEVQSSAAEAPAVESTPVQEQPPEEAAAENVYGAVLDRYYSRLITGSDDWEPRDGETGVWEATMSMDDVQALAIVGYAERDISGDGIPELLIGSAGGNGAGDVLYAVYTAVEGAPHLSFEGRSRNCFRWMGSDRIYYSGSSGAAYSAFGIYTLSHDGRALSAQDFYFTNEKGGDPAAIGFFHNTSGAWDIAASEELTVTAEEFWKIDDKLREQLVPLDLTPFTGYQYSGVAAEREPVYVRWAEEAPEITEYDIFVADEAEGRADVLFTAGYPAADFKLLALELEDVDENGRVVFRVRTLYERDALTPARALLVRMTDFGTIPHYGMSYTDASGVTRRFAVIQSGMDGSLLLDEAGDTLAFIEWE